MQGFVDGLREQLGFVWGPQWDMTWRNYVHELFQHKSSRSDTRQRHLALDQGAKYEWVAVAEISDLSPRLARGYAGKTPKTVQREPRRVRARREIISAFLPLRRTGDTVSD